jgi:microcystin-dependent protein
MWSGLTVPSGWLLCDGTNGTPDLTDRFVRGTNLAGIGTTGGSDSNTLAVGQLPAHNHTGTTDIAGAHFHMGVTDSGGAHTHTGTTSMDGSHTHTGTALSAGDHTHTIPVQNVMRQGGNAGFTAVGGNDTQGTSTNGAHTHTLSIDAGGSHSHTLNITAVDGHTHSFTTTTTGTHTHTFTTDNTGTGASIENRPSFYQLAFIMKA